MHSHFDCIGVDLETEYEFGIFTKAAMQEADPIPFRNGHLLVRRDGCGGEVWIGLAGRKSVTTANPYFRGPGLTDIRIEAIHLGPAPFRRFECFPDCRITTAEGLETRAVFGSFDGTLFGSAKPGLMQRLTGGGDPVVELPYDCPARFTIFAHDIALFDDEATLLAQDEDESEDGLRLASNAFLPVELFGAGEEWPMASSQACVVLARGTVLEATRCQPDNRLPYWHLAIETFGMAISVVAPQHLLPGAEAGRFLQVQGYLTAALEV